MSISDLTGRQRLRILMLALEHHTADEIADAVGVPEEIVQQLCRDAEIRLPRSADKQEDAACRN